MGSATSQPTPTTEIINRPLAMKALGVRRNNVSLVGADFSKWERESNQILTEILGNDFIPTTNTCCSYPRFVSENDADVEYMIFMDSIDSELIEKVEKFQKSKKSDLIVQVSDIPSGEYAYCRYVGSYDGLADVWYKMSNEKFNDFTLGETSWEEYVSTKGELITDLYWKLNKK